MDRVQLSRRINVCLGGRKNELFCTRVYINARITGGFWIPLKFTLDLLFWRHQSHCRQCYVWELRQCRKQLRAKSGPVAPSATASSL